MNEHKADDDEDDDKPSLTLINKLQIFMALSKGGIVFDMLQLIISMLSCVHYIYWTSIAYQPEYIGFLDSPGCIENDKPLEIWFRMHYFFILSFALDYCMHLMTAKSLGSHFWVVTSLADLLAITPILSYCYEWLLLNLDGT